MQLIHLLLNPIRTNGDINGVALMFYIGLVLLIIVALIERSFTNK